MTTDDDKVSLRYRSLAREEPPRHVDEAILAAARRAADARPAPLVAPTGRRRWYFPLAAAAIIILAVAVTMHVERQRPDLEIAEALVAALPKTREGELKRELEPRAQRRAEVLGEVQKPQSVPRAPAPAAAPEPAAARDAASEMREAPGKRAAMQSRAEATAGAVAGLAKASPEQWLQGIADLRRQGRHEEADRALAEFRRAYPDYRISEAMLEKVEKK
ncbi:MAG TPA: hypothetical protein VLF42_13335 [Burkholderiales bacterium]|nr:hypothetical protein [Burkholderiales bacterium]